MIIREERKEDFDEIYHLIKEAFKTAKVSDGDEQNFVGALRKGKNYIPKLALVVEDNKQLIGHIMLTEFKVKGIKALLLAPLTIMLEYRNQGVGTKLTKEALSLAKEAGYEAVFLVGHSEYYPRFGFKPSIAFGIKNVNDIPDEAVMALELKKGILKDRNMVLDFH